MHRFKIMYGLDVSALSRSHAINFMTSGPSQKTVHLELNADFTFTNLGVANVSRDFLSFLTYFL